MPTGPLAVLKDVAVRLGPTPVLDGIELELHSGESLGLAGPNGSGKTTLLRVLATLVSPSQGAGFVLGADLRSDQRWAVRSRIALLGHTPALYPELTLAENTELAARLTGRPTQGVAEVLRVVGLSAAADRRADRSSFGMQRRAELARLLLTEPDLLLLDEPHAGLDRAAAGLVEALAEATRRRGGAVVLVSHDTGRLAPLVDRLLELVGGKLVEATPSPTLSLSGRVQEGAP
ncbi:MAG: heme ABC exporter ATP-binding protein CcmA [Acidimicrobiia bacterium]